MQAYVKFFAASEGGENMIASSKVFIGKISSI